MGSSRQKPGKRRVWHGVQVGGFAAVLLLLLAVPWALATPVVGPTSSSSYSFALSGAQGDNHWQNSSQSVPIIALPSVGTTATVYFSGDNGSTYVHQTFSRTGTAAFNFSVVTEGAHAVKFYATDSTPATETPENVAGFVNIDRTDPVTTPLGLAPVSAQSTEAQWSNEVTRTVTLSATDTVPAPGVATSGVHWNLYKINVGNVVASAIATVHLTLVKGAPGGLVEGSNPVTYSAVDWAGNIETTHTGYVNVDTVAPTTEASPQLSASPTTGWHNAAVTVTLTATDASSGVAAGYTFYRLPNNPTAYLSPFTVSAQGSNLLTFQSLDRAGNVEATQTAYVNIDETSPTVSAVTSPSRSSGWYNTDVKVTLKPADAMSGVAMTQDRVSGSPTWATATANQFTIPVSPNGTKTYQYQAVDNAGNISLPTSLTVKMDTVKPKVSGTVPATVQKGSRITFGYRADDQTPKCSVTLKIKHKSSGKVARTYGMGSKTSNKSYKMKDKPNLAVGTYQYWVYATDQAGNQQGKAVATFKVK